MEHSTTADHRETVVPGARRREPVLNVPATDEWPTGSVSVDVATDDLSGGKSL
jgi:hypothetical protein